MNFTSKDISLYSNAKHERTFHILINMKLTLLLTVILILCFPSVHVVYFVRIDLVCVIFLEADNFACSEFSLKRVVSYMFASRVFSCKKDFFAILILVLLFDVNIFCIIVLDLIVSNIRCNLIVTFFSENPLQSPFFFFWKMLHDANFQCNFLSAQL